MKNIYILNFIVAMVLFSSCADLNQDPESSIDKDNFYQTENDVETAVNGIYSIFKSEGYLTLYNNVLIYIGDMSTDYARAGRSLNNVHSKELSNCAVQPTNDVTNRAWWQSYVGINRANVVIDKLAKNTNLDNSTKERYTNEAKFLRALNYFNLVRLFGSVPLVINDGEGEGQPRTPVDEVYAQIVSDFEAARNLPEEYTGSTGGRPTPEAAVACLSKVYLTWAQTDSEKGKSNRKEFYQKSLDYANHVINSGKYKLIEKFIDLFSVDKKNGSEHIFSIQHSNNENYTGHCPFSTGWSDSEPMLTTTDTIWWSRMDNADQRKEYSWAKTLWNPNTNSYFTYKVPRFRKYIDTINYAKDQFAGRNTNNVYIRYAEILLIKAEVENELNGPTVEAYEAINEVRRRAYRHFPVTQVSKDDLPNGLTQDEFREKLQRERFDEFILEGQRWFDLVRWKILVKTVKPWKPLISERNYLFPIPSDQITLNPNLTQNWGYSGETTGSPYSNYK